MENKLRFLLENENIVKEYKEKAQDYICKKYNWDDITEKNIITIRKVTRRGRYENFDGK
ncbi:MAG: hypothetical protein ACLTSM_06255 [Eubacterium sp.]